MPQGADQFANADVVRQLGVGDRLPAGEVTSAEVTHRCARVLANPSVRAATHRMAAMPAPAEVARRLPPSSPDRTHPLAVDSGLGWRRTRVAGVLGRVSRFARGCARFRAGKWRKAGRECHSRVS
ncbi:nucleotide disphospho-sugar-binding domain-containing protein [Pseudonocardia sp.]|uniref:nucleotide disphospho-sugar-binding domain-containing protein n=1 Tax=Pseudonocardia sp. TaxID=60912 RepID=UPI0039C9CA44